MKLSITTAWNETSAFVKQEAGPLFLIAFGLMTLPTIIFQAILQQAIPGFGQPGMTQADFSPGRLGLIFLLVIPIALLSMWGNLTITVLALRREAVIGSAFAYAARRLLPLIGATLLVGLAAGLLALPLVVMLRAAGADGGGSAGLAVLLFCVLFIAFLFVAVRLILMTPAAAAERIGPIAIIARSWQLTSGHFWKLLGFLALLVIVLMVLMIALGAVLGIVIVATAGRSEPGSLSSFLTLLVSGLVQAAFTMIFATMIARIYEQLTGGATSAARVFE
jgi:hypothetical protein